MTRQSLFHRRCLFFTFWPSKGVDGGLRASADNRMAGYLPFPES